MYRFHNFRSAYYTFRKYLFSYVLNYCYSFVIKLVLNYYLLSNDLLFTNYVFTSLLTQYSVLASRLVVTVKVNLGPCYTPTAGLFLPGLIGSAKLNTWVMRIYSVYISWWRIFATLARGRGFEDVRGGNTRMPKTFYDGWARVDVRVLTQFAAERGRAAFVLLVGHGASDPAFSVAAAVGRTTPFHGYGRIFIFAVLSWRVISGGGERERETGIVRRI